MRLVGLASLLVTGAAGSVILSVCQDRQFEYSEVCEEIGEIVDIMQRLSEGAVDSDALVERLEEFVGAGKSEKGIKKLVAAAEVRIHELQEQLVADATAGLHVHLNRLAVESAEVRRQLDSVVAEERIAADHEERFGEFERLLKSIRPNGDKGRLDKRFFDEMPALIAALESAPPEHVAEARDNVFRFIADMEVVGMNKADLYEMLKANLPAMVVDKALLAGRRQQLSIREAKLDAETRGVRVSLLRLADLRMRVLSRIPHPVK